MSEKPHSRKKKISNTTINVNKKPVNNNTKKESKIKSILDLFNKK